MPQNTYSKNGNVCPITSIKKVAPVAGQVLDNDHVEFRTGEILVLNRNDKSYPLSQASFSLEAPCWDESMPYQPYRSDIDYSFQQKANMCSSNFQNSYSDREFTSTGLTVNEYDLLDDAGILDTLEYNRRGTFSGTWYESAAHKRYNYNLWEKDYTFWSSQCTKQRVGPKEVEMISLQS